MSENQIEKAFRELEDERPDWRKDMLALYDQGADDAECMKELGIPPKTWELLLAVADFGDVVEFGRLWARAWWSSQGRINLHNKSFNSNLWSLNMKNRFGWSEKTEQSVTNFDIAANLDTDSLMDDIRRKLKVLNLDS